MVYNQVDKLSLEDASHHTVNSKLMTKLISLLYHHPLRFRIDLLTVNGSIAFHVNPRFNVGQVVRNTDCGGWGPEERHGPFPFRRAEPFELIISTESDHFKVTLRFKTKKYIYQTKTIIFTGCR
jgi:hypothetical protein